MKKEIVAARIGSQITNIPHEIVQAIDNGTVSEFLDRKRMQLMAACDLGIRWKKLASGPTLFILEVDAYGNVLSVSK